MAADGSAGAAPYRDPRADDDRQRLRGWRRWWTALYGGLIVVVVAAIVLGAAAGHHRHPGRHVNGTLVLVSSAVAVVVLAGVGVVAWRVQSRPGPNRQLLAAGNWRTNRRVGIALRKGRPVGAADRRSAQALVNLYARRRWVVWSYAGLGVFWLAISFAYQGFALVLHIALGLLYLGFTPYWVQLRRRTLRHGADQGLHPQLDGASRDG